MKRALIRRVRHYAGVLKQKYSNTDMVVAPEVNNSKKYLFFIDNPKREVFGDRGIVVSGWLVPLGDNEVKGMRIKNNHHTQEIKYGEKRLDVAKAVTEQEDEKKRTNCGFSCLLQLEVGTLSIEVDMGDGFEVIHSVKVHSPDDKLVDILYNPDLGRNFAEHQNLIANKHQYYYEDCYAGGYTPHAKDPRLIACYLPQFHPIPENDKVWGKGFTEWTNVAAALPRFVGHLQPMLPKDLGFYDLRLAESIQAQISLAKQYGIYGFCIYYYWFSGKKLLETPLNSIMAHKEWDFNFFICWANENWTKRWDGLDQDVIVAQKYLEEDPLNFIKDVEGILLDPRYIRENGKPILAVYRASELKDPERFANVWREYFRKKHGQELHLVSFLGFEAVDPRTYGFDASVDFAPLTFNLRKADLPGKQIPTIYVKDRLLDANFDKDAVDYRKLALIDKPDDHFDFPTYKTVIPSWDNDPRKKGKESTVFYNTNPDVYAHWLDKIIGYEVQKLGSNTPMVLVNAWNEWAEGAVLEPTQQYGGAVLNRTREILAKHSKNQANKKKFPIYGMKRKPSTRLAVVVHVFYEENWDFIHSQLSALEGTDYDLFITLSEKLTHLMGKIKQKTPDAHIVLVPNRGRDILPFLFIARRLRDAGYEYVLKLHTKRSLHRKDGKEWFEGLVESLLPSKKGVSDIMQKLIEGAAVIGPSGHLVALNSYMGSNDTHLLRLLSDMFGKKKTESITGALGEYGYFAGSMFWARISTIEPLLDLYLAPEDFESEQGQTDGTLAHAVERVFGLLPVIMKKPVASVSADGRIEEAKEDELITVYKYAS